MADSGSGVGTPVTVSVVDTTLSSADVSDLCVSFDRSLRTLKNIQHYGPTYGWKDPDVPPGCEFHWAVYQREGWINALKEAQARIMRDLGAPICPVQIQDERHQIGETIALKQAPVAYLGKKTFGVWTEVNLTEDPDNNQQYFIDICTSALSEGVEQVQFSYPDSVLQNYVNSQTLQAPRVTEHDNLCGAGVPGYRFTWDIWQLVPPAIDELQQDEADMLLSAVKWREYSIDASLAYEIVGHCDCNSCQNTDPNYTLTLCDALDGIVCIEQNGTKCTNRVRQLRLNYGTSFNYEGAIAPDLELAIVLLATVYAGKTASKPCGCDNSWLEDMLEPDPSMQFDFATKFKYGPTKAGMEVQRIMKGYTERPHFNTQVASGGLWSAKNLNKRNRYGM